VTAIKTVLIALETGRMFRPVSKSLAVGCHPFRSLYGVAWRKRTLKAGTLAGGAVAGAHERDGRMTVTWNPWLT
jgi:hypothetical protein